MTAFIGARDAGGDHVDTGIFLRVEIAILFQMPIAHIVIRIDRCRCDAEGDGEGHQVIEWLARNA